MYGVSKKSILQPLSYSIIKKYTQLKFNPTKTENLIIKKGTTN